MNQPRQPKHMGEEPKDSGRRWFLGASLATGLSLFSKKAVAQTLDAPEFSTQDGRVTIEARAGDGILRLLGSVGLSDYPEDDFRELNVDRFQNRTNVQEGWSYRLPVQTVRFRSNYIQTLEGIGLSARYVDRIHEFNRQFNPSYRVTSVGQVPANQIIWVPDWESGFYEAGSIGIAEDETVAPRAAEREVGSGTPYPSLKREAKEAPRLSNGLRGKVIVLDPGHGGNDPGSIPPARDGLGRTVEAHEADYVYDVCLRVLELATRHGAEVYLTHFSHNRGIMDSTEISRNRDHVYNLRPAGASEISVDSARTSVATRRRVTTEILGHARRQSLDVSDSVFMSVHADSAGSSRDLPLTIWTDRNDRTRGFASEFAENTGALRKTRGLGVLNGNPAQYEMLVELVNMGNDRGSWRIRSAENRQAFAERIVRGLIDTYEAGPDYSDQGEWLRIR